MWCTEVFASRLYKLDPSDGSVILSFSFPFWLSGLAFDGTSFWITGQEPVVNGDSQIYRVSQSGEILSSFKPPGPGPEDLTWDGTYLWNCDNNSDTIYQLGLPDVPELRDATLIAHYPLVAHANDVTGNVGPMTLENTPFQDGGIFANGIYKFSGDPNFAHAITPTISQLNFQGFAISAEFKVEDPNPGDDVKPVRRMPVFGGTSFRWAGVYLDTDRTVGLKYNNRNESNLFEFSKLTYSWDTWHEATITYDGVTLKLYFDGVLATSVATTLNHGNNRKIGITDFSNGRAFQGIFRNLKIFNLFQEPVPTELILVSGADQIDAPGATLLEPFVVEVRDQNGIPFQGASVLFRITEGGGMLSNRDDVEEVDTDLQGRAQTILKLGPDAGLNQVRAIVEGIADPVIFKANGLNLRQDFDDVEVGPVEGIVGNFLVHPVNNGGLIEVVDTCEERICVELDICSPCERFGNVVRMVPNNQGDGIAIRFPATDTGIKLPNLVAQFWMLVDDVEGGVTITDTQANAGDDPSQQGNAVSFVVTRKGAGWVLTTRTNGTPRFEGELEYPIQERIGYFYKIIFARTLIEDEFECHVFVNGRLVERIPLVLGEMNAENIFTYLQADLKPGDNSQLLFDDVAFCPEGAGLETVSPSPVGDGIIVIEGDDTTSTSARLDYATSPSVRLKLEAVDIGGSGLDRAYIDGDVRMALPLEWGEDLQTHEEWVADLLSEGDGEKTLYVIFEDGSCNTSDDTDLCPRDTDPDSCVYPSAQVILDTTEPEAKIDEIIPGPPYSIRGTAQDTNFKGYTLHYQEVGTSTWIPAGSGSTAVEEGELGSWTPPDNSDYTIRLTVEDEAGWTSESEPVPVPNGVLSFTRSFTISQGIGFVHIPLKVITVDGEAKTLDTIGDVFDALVPDVNFLITYNDEDERWESYLGDQSRNTDADRELTDDLGFIAVMNARVELGLEGNPLGDGTSSINLNVGLNLVGLPVQDPNFRQISDLFNL